MKLPFTKKDTIFTSSEYASMITLLKIYIKNLGNDAGHHADRYLERLNSENLESSESFGRDMVLWINELRNILSEFEFYGRATTLKTFFHSGNYLYTLRSPVTKGSDQRRKIPVHNITFPTHEENELSYALYKLKSKKRCTGKNLAKNSICGMTTIKHT